MNVGGAQKYLGFDIYSIEIFKMYKGISKITQGDLFTVDSNKNERGAFVQICQKSTHKEYC